MKKILSILLISSSFALLAQSEYNYMNWNIYSFEGYITHNVPAVKDKTVKIKITKTKNGKVTEYLKKYDSNAKLLKYAKIEKDGERLIKVNVFNSEGKALNEQSYRRGKLKRELVLKRDAKGRTISSKKFKKDKKLQSASTWTYLEGDCMKSSKLLKADGKTIKKQWDYEYYEACQKKKSTLKNGKGKIIKEWTYDCKEEGEILTKKKDITQVCKWEEADDKHLKKITQSFDEKGKIVKYVNVYRASDTALLSIKRYRGNDELHYEYTYDYDHAKPLTYRYYKKGKVRHENGYTYEGDNLISSISTYKGKSRKVSYEYDSNDLLTTMSSYNYKGEISRKTELSYN